MNNRSDRIETILNGAGGRMRAKEIHDALADVEGVDKNDLNAAIVPSTTRQDNVTRRNAGRQVRFNLYNDGDEDWGYISLVAPAAAAPADPVPELIEKTNSEVQRMRGIKGNSDTAVIVTSSNFTGGAVTEAEPSQNQRAIVLVDGDLIVDTCLEHGIGVRKRELPALYAFSGFDEPDDGEPAG